MRKGASTPSHTGTATIAIALVLVGVLLGSALAYHVRAESAYRRSLESGLSLDARYAAASTAAQLEPFSARYAARERRIATWMRADTLLAAGDYKAAVLLLSSAFGRTPAEPELLALYRKAQAVQTLETNRKAHLQHGHEGAGGTLTPTDIER